jgi:hypothetical protein
VLKHSAANRKRRLSALPNVGPYIYTTLAFLALLGAPYIYIYDISRVSSANNSLQAHRSNYIRRLHHWLLLSPPDSTSIGPIDVPIDSHVTVARQSRDAQWFSLQNVYRIKNGQPLITTAPHDWRPGETLPRTGRRDNYRGITINAATVVSEVQPFVIDMYV